MGLRNYLAERRARKLFPKKKGKFWYCGAIYDYSYELHRASKPWRTKELELPCETFLINPYSDAGGKIPEVGDIAPCVKLDGWIGYYEVTKRWRYSSAGSDFASWDDGYEVNLRLHHCVRAEKTGGYHE